VHVQTPGYVGGAQQLASFNGPSMGADCCMCLALSIRLWPIGLAAEVGRPARYGRRRGA